MTTTIIKKIAFDILDQMFENPMQSQKFSIRYYALKKGYKNLFEITIRHPEGTDALELIESEIKKITQKLA